MPGMLALFSNSTINADSVITLVTRAKSRIARRAEIRSNARSGRNTLLGLPNEPLNLIFEMACTGDGGPIRVSDPVTQMKDQEEPVRNEYYRKAHPKDMDMWLEVTEAEETGMPLSLKMRAIIDDFFENTFGGTTLLSYERLMAPAATCSTIRQLWGGMPFALNKWEFDTAMAVNLFLKECGLNGQQCLQNVTIAVCSEHDATLLRSLLVCQGLRDVHIRLPHEISAQTSKYKPWPGLQHLKAIRQLPNLQTFTVSCFCAHVPSADKDHALCCPWI
jgi:hypothetical protein